MIWPPSHDLAAVQIPDVTDPDGDPVTITINSISQDEPATGHGSGNTCPDGSGSARTRRWCSRTGRATKTAASAFLTSNVGRLPVQIRARSSTRRSVPERVPARFIAPMASKLRSLATPRWGRIDKVRLDRCAVSKPLQERKGRPFGHETVFPAVASGTVVAHGEAEIGFSRSVVAANRAPDGY
jgi:hypothetical protein